MNGSRLVSESGILYDEAVALRWTSPLANKSPISHVRILLVSCLMLHTIERTVFSMPASILNWVAELQYPKCNPSDFIQAD